MSVYLPLAEVPAKPNYKPGDYLVIFGELFNRGYVNGLIQEAESYGLKIIYSTVGRRDESGLRKLNSDELASASKPIINIPLEAGFELEKSDNGISPSDQLKDVKLDNWQSYKLNWNEINSSVKKGQARFKTHVQEFYKELETCIDPSKNIFIAHLMAGGVPRAKIFMAILNRVVKPKGDKFITSEEFWNSELGRLADISFNEVTADTFSTLISESSSLSQKIKQANGSLRFSAYGYHGTEIIIKDKPLWQSYAPYIQGWAKLRLEKHSQSFQKSGIRTCVYNCPEILTNSSSIFQGVEVPLYPLISAFKKFGPEQAYTENLFSSCQELLKPNVELNDLIKVAEDFFSDTEIKNSFNKFDLFPQHNKQSQIQKLVDCSNRIIDMHKDEKKLITAVLSEEILKGTGKLIFANSFTMKNPVLWLNHDIIVKQILTSPKG